ncbi:hypothetical protein [Flavobacterium limnosediminis]|uniref:hypothetical protein n=1 Tax=Flavobacterium limnosediminis TaxID=1401027 RepID=UPI00041E1052|nr:hypothetical protein [Flavobacterium limnosediminis]
MIRLRTKTKFTVPFERGVRSEFIHLIIERLDIDALNITPIGYYYFIDENDQVQKLDDIKQNPKLWEDIEFAELGTLPEMNSMVHLKQNIIQRLTEFTLFQLQMEDGTNYGTSYTDWELVI